ncbi:MAG TPA: hypothetical protein VMZ00_16350 [Sporichthya sp.]|nr:hypothetical protein [Sporichthya sp.]
MGHWSVMSSLDHMEGRSYLVPLPLEEAILEVGYALQSEGRVLCEQTPDGRYVTRTVKHTPGWAFVLPFLLPFVRRTKLAELVFTPAEGGTAVTVHGDIDTGAAMRLRDMTTLMPLAVPVPQ